MNKIVLIGCGYVGMSYAYSMLNQKVSVDELILIDLNKDLALGEVLDLNHSLAFAPNKIKIKVGDYSDCNDATIICICAGANQEVGESRIDLIEKNTKVFKNIISKINETNFDGIYLIATNPVDVMTYITYKYSKFDYKKVIGSGTTLDTARLRFNLSEKLNINAKNIHAYVIGEHGDSEFVAYASANVGNMPITSLLDEDELNEIADEVRTAAYKIIKLKGATNYAIGMALTRITNAILGNEHSILTVSSYDKDKDLFIGYPTIVSKKGAESRIDILLSDEEKKKLNNSENIIKELNNKMIGGSDLNDK